MKKKEKIIVVSNAAIFYFVFRARAEAEEARQKAKEDDDVGVCASVFCINNSELDVRSPCAFSECC